MPTNPATRAVLESAIERYGNYTGLAKRLRLTLSTVHGWKLRGNLPFWRQAQIEDAIKMDSRRAKRERKRKRKAARNGGEQ